MLEERAPENLKRMSSSLFAATLRGSTCASSGPRDPVVQEPHRSCWWRATTHRQHHLPKWHAPTPWRACPVPLLPPLSRAARVAKEAGVSDDFQTVNDGSCCAECDVLVGPRSAGVESCTAWEKCARRRRLLLASPACIARRNRHGLSSNHRQYGRAIYVPKRMSGAGHASAQSFANFERGVDAQRSPTTDTTLRDGVHTC